MPVACASCLVTYYDSGCGCPAPSLREIAQRELRRLRLARAREKGTHYRPDWLEMVERCARKCVRCGDHGQTKDHIVPIYQGGSDGLDNLQPLCLRCNAAKGPEAIDHRLPDVARWALLKAEEMTMAKARKTVNREIKEGHALGTWS